MVLKPALDGGRLVGRGVVEHEVHVEVCGHLGVDHVQEAAELLGAMARRHLRGHLTRGDVERRKEVGRAVAEVVVGASLGHARHERQHRRRAVERLDLRLLVDAEDDRRLGRVEVQPDEVSHPVDELRIGRELERLGAAEILSRSRDEAESPRDETSVDASASLGPAEEGHPVVALPGYSRRWCASRTTSSSSSATPSVTIESVRWRERPEGRDHRIEAHG
jgi:hypothetical protein